MDNCLYTVIPCYNEEEVLKETASRLKEKYEMLINDNKISSKSRIVFVNDGSKDKTWDIINDLHDDNEVFSGINLSRNRGHQNALLAGLITCKDYCDMVISMDADLQDDINAMDKMIDSYLNGNDIVYGVRNKRDTDTFFKRFTAESFYKIMSNMGVETVYNHADYRLMSKRAIEALAGYKEVNLFLRGIIPLIGYKTDIVTYERGERFAGESKYPLSKMLSFAVQGITSFSVQPLNFIFGLGCVTTGISLIMIIYNIVKFFMGKAITEISCLMMSVWLIGGLILISIGIVGAYIGKIYLESKERPRFLVDEFLNKE